jgi:hypothetical protein
MINSCIFTIIAPNYLGQALTLKNSLQKYSSDIDFKIILVSDKKVSVDESLESSIIYSSDIEIDNYQKVCFSYNILEHCTNIKPACFKFFLNSYDFIYYIDPDIYFYQSPISINDLFGNMDVLITPHSLTPILDDFQPTELEFLRTGTFNLGFLGIKTSPRVKGFLDWWASRTEEFGINETNSGLFVDQKWMDLAPCFFDFVHISRHPGLNVGYWNLHERKITYKQNVYHVGNAPLIFFHFSGLDPKNFQKISKHQSRFFIETSEDIFNMFKDYSDKLLLNSDNPLKDLVPYSVFDNGVEITELARKYFWKHSYRYSTKGLFSAKGQLFNDCKQMRLLSKISLKNTNFGSQSDLSKFSLQIKTIEFILNLIKFLLGPVRFYLLKKYILQRFSLLTNFYKW